VFACDVIAMRRRFVPGLAPSGREGPDGSSVQQMHNGARSFRKAGPALELSPRELSASAIARG
jgi:hypothetical protein